MEINTVSLKSNLAPNLRLQFVREFDLLFRSTKYERIASKFFGQNYVIMNGSIHIKKDVCRCLYWLLPGTSNLNCNKRDRVEIKSFICLSHQKKVDIDRIWET